VSQVRGVLSLESPGRAVAAPDKKLLRIGTFKPRSSSMSLAARPLVAFLARGVFDASGHKPANNEYCNRAGLRPASPMGCGQTWMATCGMGIGRCRERGGSAATGSGELIGRIHLPATISCRVQILRLGSSVTDPGDRCTICEDLGPADNPARPGQTEHRM
jgi:hypothetical protein